MTYLGGGGSGDDEMEALRNRLNGAVGSRYQQQQQQRGSISAVNNQRFGKVRTTSSELCLENIHIGAGFGVVTV